MVSAARMKRPSDWIMVMDGRGGERVMRISPLFTQEQAVELGYARHQGGLNALFYDSHVKWMKLEDSSDARFWTREGVWNQP